QAGALASGAELKVTPESKPYAEFRTYQPALEAYKKNATVRGRVFADPKTAGRMNRASTDMGNVSQIVPAIHPYIGVDSLPHTNHQKEFADSCVGPIAEQAMLDAAILMAWTTIDVFAETKEYPGLHKIGLNKPVDYRSTGERLLAANGLAHKTVILPLLLAPPLCDH